MNSRVRSSNFVRLLKCARKRKKSLLDTLRKETVRAFTVNWKLCTKCKKVMLISFYKDEKTTQKFY